METGSNFGENQAKKIAGQLEDRREKLANTMNIGFWAGMAVGIISAAGLVITYFMMHAPGH